MDYFKTNLDQLHEQLRSGKLTSRQLVDETLAGIDKIDPEVAAFLAINADGAKKQAAAIDEAGIADDQPLSGVPIAIKDNIVTKGVVTTAASKILENFNPIYDATVMQKLAAAGAINVGKTNLDEFAMGSSTENSAFKTTKNAWDHRVSRWGLIAFSSSLDQIGTLTRGVKDAAQILNVIAGHDERDSTTADTPVPDFTAKIGQSIKGMKIALPKEYLGEGVDPEVAAKIKAAAKQLEALGATVSEVSLPHTQYAVPSYYIIASSEASSNLQRFDGIRYGFRAKDVHNIEDVYVRSRSEGFGPEVKRRIMLGTFSLSAGFYDAYFKKAGQVRTLITRDFEAVFEDYDLIIGPTTPTVAFKIGEKVTDPVTMYMNDILTIPVNLAGLPAASVPAGFVDGLPVGLQLIGKHFDESTIFQVAAAFEAQNDYLAQIPGGK